MRKHGEGNRARIEEKQMGKKRGPYLVLLVNDTKAKDAKLKKSEWDILEKLFSKHPELARVECPDRMYPDV